MSKSNPFVASDTPNKKFDPVPAGIHPGILVALYDVGWHYDEKFDKKAKKLIASFELPGLPPLVIPAKDDMPEQRLPRGIVVRWNRGLGEKSRMRADLQKWRGRPFTPEETKAFDVSKLLGVGANVYVMHETKADGSIKSFVDSLLPLPKAQWPTTKTPHVIWSIEQVESLEELDHLDLPKWIKEEAKKSEEYEKLVKRAKGGAPEGMVPDRTHEEPPPAGPDAEDEVPF